MVKMNYDKIKLKKFEIFITKIEIFSMQIQKVWNLCSIIGDLKNNIDDEPSFAYDNFHDEEIYFYSIDGRSNDVNTPILKNRY